MSSTRVPSAVSSSVSSRSSDSGDRSDAGIQAWQLFAIAGLIGATAVVFMSRGQSSVAVILLSLTIFAAAAVGHAALRTLLPLAVSGLAALAAPVMGGRARATLEREKALVLRSIKELEFDRAMGKVSEKDFTDMSARLRGRAGRLMQRLDATADYRTQIEREIARRLERSGVTRSAAKSGITGGATQSIAAASTLAASARALVAEPSATACSSCATLNDPDARFCKRCGLALQAQEQAVEPMATCAACGAELEADAAFCVQCGEQAVGA